MAKIKSYSNCVERFLQSPRGQRFLNIAYSVGAAIVIWGALFEILHMPGGKLLLCIGMGTEVVMFLLTAFDRPPSSIPHTENAVASHPSEVRVNSGNPVTPAYSLPDADGISDLNRHIAQLRETTRILNEAGEMLNSSFRDTAANLNNVSGINNGLNNLRDIYEKSAREAALYYVETEKMVENLKQINAVYEKMITAMTINMSHNPNNNNTFTPGNRNI